MENQVTVKVALFGGANTHNIQLATHETLDQLRTRILEYVPQVSSKHQMRIINHQKTILPQHYQQTRIEEYLKAYPMYTRNPIPILITPLDEQYAAWLQSNTVINQIDLAQIADDYYVLSLLHSQPSLLKHLSREKLEDIKFMLDVVAELGVRTPDYMPSKLKQHPSIVLQLLRVSGLDEDLQAIPWMLRNSYQFMKEAVQVNPRAYLYTTESVQRNLNLACLALAQDGQLLEKVPRELYQHRQVLEVALRTYPASLKFIPDTLQEEFNDLVKMAVAQNGSVLRYASKAQRSNAEVVRTAALQNISALEYADESLRGQYNFMLSMVSKDGMLLKYASRELRDNLSLVKVAVRQNAQALSFVSGRLVPEVSTLIAQNGGLPSPPKYIKAISCLTMFSAASSEMSSESNASSQSTRSITEGMRHFFRGMPK